MRQPASAIDGTACLCDYALHQGARQFRARFLLDVPDRRASSGPGNRIMANTSSAKKAARQAVRRTLINKTRKSRMRTFVRKVEEALEKGDKTAAAAALTAAEPEMMRAAQKGVLHKNTASRKVSRLAARVRGLTA
jgi:small subunit ribosomal protein S20